MRILIVEDEQAIAAFIIQGLTEAGYSVDHAATGASTHDAPNGPDPRGPDPSRDVCRQTYVTL